MESYIDTETKDVEIKSELIPLVPQVEGEGIVTAEPEVTIVQTDEQIGANDPVM